jgi:D-alanyl-D-alanine carboxypeptidase/D-alanyl-D-alanine-endopeptidase (penicillin-binding protein 4)
MTTSITILAILLSALGPDQRDPSALANGLSTILKSIPSANVQVTAVVTRLPDGQTIFAKNPDLPLVPASVHKILPAAVALDVLGIDHQFRTTLFTRGPDVIVVGGGDPGLGDLRLATGAGVEPLTVFQKWADDLLARGVSEVADIVIDDRVFESTTIHPSWESGDLPKWFAAPVGALNFNTNCVEFTIHPTRPGEPTSCSVFPPTPWIQIENRSTTGNKKNPWVHRDPRRQVYSIRGQCRKETAIKPVSVTDPGIFTGEVFKTVLIRQGISVLGTVRRITTADDTSAAQEVATWHTPMANVLSRALQQSQNLFAECLLKAAGTGGSSGRQGSWAAGQAEATRRMEKWGIDLRGLVVADGSGLSRSNRMTARQANAILTVMYRTAPQGDMFIRSLAENGRSGTLRKRMQALPGRLWGKTGYMSGIRSLSGLVRANESGNWYAITVIFNDIPGGTAPYNRIHDRMCDLLARN